MNKKRKRQALGIGGIVVLGVLLSLFALGPFDITGTTTRTVNATGHVYELVGIPGFGFSQYSCGGKQPIVTEESTSDVLRISGRIPSTGSRDCSDYVVGTTVTLKSVDLTTKERVIIHRSARVNSHAKGGNGCTSDLNGLNGAASSRDGPTSKSWGVVTITNDRNARVLRIYGDGDDAAGKIIPYQPNQSVYFTNTITASTKGIVYGSELSYMITGVEVTEFPTATTPAPVATSPPVITSPPTTPYTPPTSTAPPVTTTSPPSPEPAKGFLARLLEWIKTVFR